jgi:hypothetical protein
VTKGSRRCLIFQSGERKAFGAISVNFVFWKVQKICVILDCFFIRVLFAFFK